VLPSKLAAPAVYRNPLYKQKIIIAEVRRDGSALQAQLVAQLDAEGALSTAHAAAPEVAADVGVNPIVTLEKQLLNMIGNLV
jgi:hypothetical protein